MKIDNLEPSLGKNQLFQGMKKSYLQPETSCVKNVRLNNHSSRISQVISLLLR